MIILDLSLKNFVWEIKDWIKLQETGPVVCLLFVCFSELEDLHMFVDWMEGANKDRDIEGIRGGVEKIVPMPCPWKERVSIAGAKGEYQAWKRGFLFLFLFFNLALRKKGKKVKMKYFISLLVFLRRCSAEPFYYD